MREEWTLERMLLETTARYDTYEAGKISLSLAVVIPVRVLWNRGFRKGTIGLRKFRCNGLKVLWGSGLPEKLEAEGGRVMQLTLQSNSTRRGQESTNK